VLSPFAQRQKRFAVSGIERFDLKERRWKEITIEDARPSPAEQAAWRLDFLEWLKRLPVEARRIALTLASGETTGGAAKLYRLSPGRISQIRRALRENWHAFHRQAEFVALKRPATANVIPAAKRRVRFDVETDDPGAGEQMILQDNRNERIDGADRRPSFAFDAKSAQ
jgi:hypothetical protein